MAKRFAKICSLAIAVCTLASAPMGYAVAAPTPPASLCGSSTPKALLDYLKSSKVELLGEKTRIHCDPPGLPNFDVKFSYDPQSSQTDEYFHELYFSIARFIHNHNYSLTDKGDDLKIYINMKKRTKKSYNMSIRYEKIPS